MSVSVSEVGRLSLELDELRKQVEHLYRHLGISYTPPEAPYTTAARALVAEGKETDAVKLVRDATGLGLVEAKTIVDRLAP